MFIFNLLSSLSQHPQFNTKGLELVNKVLQEICPSELYDNDDYQALRGKEVLFTLTDLGANYLLTIPDSPLAPAASPLSAAEESSKSPLLVVREGTESLAEGLTPALKLSTNLNTLQALASKEADVEALIAAGQIKIEGNQNLLLNLINLSTKIDYSAENILSKFIGDIPAYFLANAGERVLAVATAINDFISGLGESPLVEEEDPFQDHSLAAQEAKQEQSQSAEVDPFVDHSQSSSTSKESQGLPHPLELARGLVDSLSSPATKAKLENAKAKVEEVISSLPPASELEQPLAEIKNTLASIKKEEVQDFVTKAGDIASSLFKALKK